VLEEAVEGLVLSGIRDQPPDVVPHQSEERHDVGADPGDDGGRHLATEDHFLLFFLMIHQEKKGRNLLRFKGVNEWPKKWLCFLKMIKNTASHPMPEGW
jgi:hypothetical protein